MLNLKNTLDGYLKNVEVIGNTIQDTNNLANIRSVGDKIEGQELYKIDVVSSGKNLFKMCKDNETHRNSYNGIIEIQHNGFSLTDTRNGDMAGFVMKCKPNTEYVVTFNDVSSTKVQKFFRAYTEYPIDSNANYNINVGTTNGSSIKLTTTSNCNYIFFGVYGGNGTSTIKDIQVEEGTVATPYEPYKEDKLEILSPVQLEKVGNVVDRLICKDGVWGVDKKVNAEVKNNVLVNTRTNSEFIPLPHDQQVKLRTFAGQTNIEFLTEIPGQIKAQVPKSLGATVNTHTEQITDLHNSLDRVKKLEETTVSTVETGSSFTTVDATSNGYFEDVKLEGKTLVNLLGGNGYIENVTNGVYYTPLIDESVFKKGVEYTLILLNTNEKIKKVYMGNGSNTTLLQLQLMNNTGLYKFIYNYEVPNNKCHVYVYTTNDNLLTDEEKANIKFMVLEGDHTNNPPSYFEGLMSVGQDVEEFSIEGTSDGINNSNNQFKEIDATTGSESNHPNAIVSTYNHISADSDNIKLYRNGMEIIESKNLRKRYYRKDKTYIGSQFTNDAYYVRFRFITNDGTAFGGAINEYKILDAGLNEQVCNKKSLLYYNPNTQTWEKPVLREWDTIEKHSDGKYYYHKRSGEVVLNHNSVWEDFDAHSFVNRQYFHDAKDNITNINVHGVICNNFNYGEVVLGNSAWRYYKTKSNVWSMFAKKSNQTLEQFKSELATNPIKVVYQLAQEEVYECTNIDLMTYSGETNYIINSGAISPKSLLKVHNNISNVVKILQEKVSLLENTFIAGLKSVLSGDMYSLATILYPEDFEQNDNTEQDIMVIPE